jgi:hypothetical protein
VATAITATVQDAAVLAAATRAGRPAPAARLGLPAAAIAGPTAARA